MGVKSKNSVALNSLDELITYLYDWAQNNENIEHIENRENNLNQNITFPFNVDMQMVIFNLHADTTRAAVNHFLDIAEESRILSRCFQVDRTKKGNRLTLRIPLQNSEKYLKGWYCYDTKAKAD